MPPRQSKYRENDRFPVGHRGLPPAVRRVRLIACACGKGDYVVDNASAHIMPSDVIAKKFREKGWRIGKAAGKDECPRCIAKPKHKPKEEPAVAQNNPDHAKPVVQLVPPAPEPPRQPTREDRRLIVDELDRTYDLTNMRYPGKLDDAALAARLEVPRAWVSELREQLYGPEANEAQAQREAKLDELDQKLAELETKAYGELERICSMIAALKKQLDALR